jgi:hypothetical protein
VEILDLKESKGLLGLRVNKDLKERQDLLDHKDHKANKDHKERQDLLGHKVSKDLRESKDHKERQVLLGLRESKDLLDLLDLLGLKVNKDLLGTLAQQETYPIRLYTHFRPPHRKSLPNSQLFMIQLLLWLVVVVITRRLPRYGYGKRGIIMRR